MCGFVYLGFEYGVEVGVDFGVVDSIRVVGRIIEDERVRLFVLVVWNVV